MTAKSVSIKVGSQDLVIETGKVAKQADGSAWIRYGDTIVLVTACAAPDKKEGLDFFPLTVEYQEKMYSSGRIPGGFFKREGRPTEKETLTCRVVDRSIRPLFAEGFGNETQVIATVLSMDLENDADVLALTGASVALSLSSLPWAGPLAGIRVGRKDGQFIANPTLTERAACDLDVILAASRDAIVMVEGGAKEVPEAVMVEALLFGHKAALPIVLAQEKLRAELGHQKLTFEAPKHDAEFTAKVRTLAWDRIAKAYAIGTKMERYAELSAVKKAVLKDLGEAVVGREKEAKGILEDLKYEYMRGMIVNENRRIANRRHDEVRQITAEVGVLPRTHGSSLFTRGETQALVTATLGTRDDEQRIESLTGQSFRKFLLHYNFPPYSVGEVKRVGSAGRREIGHGKLAERALLQVLPAADKFPYTIRVVSEILESNGSSSMASVCGGCLALMDAGVPISSPVAGIAMGLIKEGGKIAILSDILGDEDHLGDMDFKVCGTKNGITSIQMDIKIAGVDQAILTRALEQARVGRLHILDKMLAALATPRADISKFAPRITTLKIRPERIKDVIGPGGKVIKDIVARTGCSINVEDDGTVSIASANPEGAEQAIKMVKNLTQDAEIGKTYLGTVRKIVEFGAFVEIFPGTDGLIHISELSDKRVKQVTDVLHEGDEVLVKVLSVDRQGKIRLSRKEALAAAQGEAPAAKPAAPSA